MKHIAVLGAGASGLVSAVTAQKYGMQVTIFEQNQRLGGVWSSDDLERSLHGSAWPKMKVNISRHTGVFSGLAWPDGTNDFPTTDNMFQYLHSYATRYQLHEKINYGAKVISVKRQDNTWVVCYQQNGETSEKMFDGIILATGKSNLPFIPEIAGLEKIQNKMNHSAHYDSPTDLPQRILVVGGAISGTSIAEELALAGKTVIHVFRTPRWIMSRYQTSEPGMAGPLLPRDISKTYHPEQPASQEQVLKEVALYCENQNKYPQWRVSPGASPGFVVADEYLKQIDVGNIKPYLAEIKRFYSDRVVIVDKSAIEQELYFDHVILCTGYRQKLPILPADIKFEQNKLCLWEDIFPVNVPDLACIGMYSNARGAAFPVFEMQAEMACRVLSEQYTLPHGDKMQQDLSVAKPVSQIEYLRKLADMLQIKPTASTANSSLLSQAPYLPLQYFLDGPNDTEVREMSSKTILYRQKLLRAQGSPKPGEHTVQQTAPIQEQQTSYHIEKNGY